ncbi:hypothetical protein PAMC26510_22155 [Caballeronia sordidicola]|uniref:Uncharacterized protein n=1 Tax=Caballeronia sordidicola TaxID=196367 RepID=A0A242MLN6_CABSO|nr:hypothetical protein PAMC26510_22155 [Caballeronia sordidicola]
METTISNGAPRVPWNKDKLTGQKSPLKLKEIWACHFSAYWRRAFSP